MCCDRPSRHRFSWFSSLFKQILGCSQFSSCYCMFLMRTLRFKSIKIIPFVWRPLNCFNLQIIISKFVNKNQKFRCSCCRALTIYHSNDFNSVLSSSDGRTKIALKLSNGSMILPSRLPRTKVSLFSSIVFLFSPVLLLCFLTLTLFHVQRVHLSSSFLQIARISPPY